ncbi:hypothetical protein NDU88_000803 [Pleurodeles waltl]|uniref:Uncharacterized protein n=1 Tax=Pleurodeles waltl TaxID=8319 RepID=A0AAV7P1Z6_PLEWA|nr:hypothetical protein NDU88_000803 [Pleurodeles waltl]
MRRRLDPKKSLNRLSGRGRGHCRGGQGGAESCVIKTGSPAKKAQGEKDEGSSPDPAIIVSCLVKDLCRASRSPSEANKGFRKTICGESQTRDHIETYIADHYEHNHCL